MQCWLTCVVGYISLTPPPLPHGMHNTNIFRGFHGDINRYIKYKRYQSLAGIMREQDNCKEKKQQQRIICMHLCVYIAMYKIHKNPRQLKKYMYMFIVYT